MSFEKVDLKIHIKERLKTVAYLKSQSEKMAIDADAIQAEMDSLARNFEIELTKGETK